MHSQVLKYRLYNLALRANPQKVTLLLRSNNTTFTAYTLQRATYQQIDTNELVALGGFLGQFNRAWTLYRADLEQASVPLPLSPLISYAIGDQQAGTFTGNTTQGSSTISGLASTAGIVTGMACAGPGIPNFARVTAVTSSTVTLDQAATAAATGVSLAFGYWWTVARVESVEMDAAYVCSCHRGR